jgi:hypothetical protein
MSEKAAKQKAGERKKTPRQKGDALESAVKAIEQSILRMAPNAAGRNFTIECKKLIKVGDVPHEIDAYVTVHFAPKYDSVFIFECKNWEGPVDKNEIIIFSEKIAASKATHGYVVAKLFTSGAKAQAEKDKRITLLTVEEHDPLLSGFLSSAPRGLTLTPVAVGFNVIAKDGSRLKAPDPSTLVSYRGGQKAIGELLRSWANEAAAQGRPDQLLDKLGPGEHQVGLNFERMFTDGELEIFGKDVQKISAGGDFTVFIFHHVIEYSFDVKSRGRVISFASVPLPDGSVVKSKIVITYKEGTS